MNLYCAFIVVPQTQCTQVRITQCYLQITPYLPLPHKRSPDGAYPDWGCRHQLQPTIHVSTSKRMKGWVGLVGWPTADGLPTSGHRSAVGQANEQGKFAAQRPTFYQLCHATNHGRPKVSVAFVCLSVRPSRTYRITRVPEGLTCPISEWRFPTSDATRIPVLRSKG